MPIQALVVLAASPSASWVQLACELQRDWARTGTATEFKEILFGPAPVVDATGLGA